MKQTMSFSRIILYVFFLIVFHSCKKSGENGGGEPIQGDYATLTVTVKDAENGSHLDGVTIQLNVTGISAESKGNGQYEFKNLKYISYDIFASKTGYNMRKVNILIERKDQITTIELTPESPTVGDFLGTINPDGFNFEKAYIMLIADDLITYRESKSDRSFVFENLPYGKNYELNIHAKGYLPKTYTIQEWKNSINNNQPYQISPYDGSLFFDDPFIDMGGPATQRDHTDFAIHAPENHPWEIIYDNRNWIKPIDPLSGNGDDVITVEIDRSRLNRGNNYATFTVKSTANNNSWSDKFLLFVSEDGTGVNLTDLTIQEAIDITPNLAKIQCEIWNLDLIDNGYEFGVIWTSTPGYFNETNSNWQVATNRSGTSYTVNVPLVAGKIHWIKAFARKLSETDYSKRFYESRRIIEINSNVLPSQAAITGDKNNNCPNPTVLLTASASGATDYKWYKDNVLLSATGDKLTVSSSGTYYAIGINSFGDGIKSSGHDVTISSCIPSAPSSLKAVMEGDGIKLTWHRESSLANNYEVQVSNYSNMAYANTVYVSTDAMFPSYTFEASSLFCDRNYFQVKAVNSAGSSVGTTTFCDRIITLTPPELSESLASMLLKDRIDLTWKASIGASSIQYVVERKKGNDPWQIITTTSGTSYSEALPKETEFGVAYNMYYRIKAKTTVCGKEIDSGYSTTVQKSVSWIR